MTNAVAKAIHAAVGEQRNDAKRTAKEKKKSKKEEEEESRPKVVKEWKCGTTYKADEVPKATLRV